MSRLMERLHLADVDGMNGWGMAVVFGIPCLLLFVALGFAVQAAADDCRARGGTYETTTSVGSGTVVVNGKVGTGLVTSSSGSCVGAER
jgi:hypothetical protein